MTVPNGPRGAHHALTGSTIILDESLRKYSENWQLRNELKNQAVSQLKQEVLHGELKEERRLYTNTFRLYRFVVNPKKAIIRELKKMGTDLLTGRER